MRYIDIVQLDESILSELESVPSLNNTSKEIGSGGQAVTADMTDMLPHHGVFERNKPQAYSEIFAKTQGQTYETGFERESPPGSETLKTRRNNAAGIKKLKPVSKQGDASAILHSDFASHKPNERSIMPPRKITYPTS